MKILTFFDFNIVKKEEEIIEKKLYVLIPFYLLRYKIIMKDAKNDERKVKPL